MPGILERLNVIRADNEKIVREAKQDERRELFDIAIRDALGKPNSDDVDRLGELVTLLDFNDKQYTEIVKAVSTACRLAAGVEVADEQAKTHDERFMEARRKTIVAHHESFYWQRVARDLLGFPSKHSTVKGDFAKHRDQFAELFDKSGNVTKALRAEVKKQKAARLEADQNVADERDQRLKNEIASALTRAKVPFEK